MPLIAEHVAQLVAALNEPDYHDPACPFVNHCYCDDGAPHDRVQHPLAEQAAATLEAQQAEIARLRAALEPFATFADSHIDAEGWNGPMRTTRIVDWFGPSDFRTARAAFEDGRE